MGRSGSTSGEKQAALAGLPDLGGIVGYRLRRAQLCVFQDFIESFQRLKLRPAEFSVLVLIGRQPGQKQSEVARQLGIKRANFVALMDTLERRGLAERRKSIEDKRSHSLHLTPDGVQFAARMMKAWHRHEQRFVERLGGEAERDRLLELLDRIITRAPDEAD